MSRISQYLQTTCPSEQPRPPGAGTRSCAATNLGHEVASIRCHGVGADMQLVGGGAGDGGQEHGRGGRAAAGLVGEGEG